jgi:hypothetical protein
VELIGDREAVGGGWAVCVGRRGGGMSVIYDREGEDAQTKSFEEIG